MRIMQALFVLGALGACQPKKAPEPAAAQGPLHPDLKCPPGTVPAGTPPPRGWEVWCQKAKPNGTFIRQGPAISWHTNEQKSSEGSFVEGRRDGPWLFWYPTGQPERQGSYVNGKEEGVWTSYNANGDPSSEGQMVDGHEHGKWIYWNAETLTRIEGQYVFGERDGLWLDYGPDDQPIRERTYRAGRMLSQREL